MTAQTKLRVAWGTVVSVIGLGALVLGVAWRNGGAIAVTQEIACQNQEALREVDARSHDNKEGLARTDTNVDNIFKGIEDLKANARANKEEIMQELRALRP